MTRTTTPGAPKTSRKVGGRPDALAARRILGRPGKACADFSTNQHRAHGARADGNYIYCSKIASVSAPEVPKLSETDPKDKLVERLKASLDFCTMVLAKLDDSSMGETLTIGEVKSSRAMTILTLSSSWATHYSTLESYLQLNGLPSPSVRK